MVTCWNHTGKILVTTRWDFIWYATSFLVVSKHCTHLFPSTFDTYAASAICEVHFIDSCPAGVLHKAVVRDVMETLGREGFCTWIALYRNYGLLGDGFVYGIPPTETKSFTCTCSNCNRWVVSRVPVGSGISSTASNVLSLIKPKWPPSGDRRACSTATLIIHGLHSEPHSGRKILAVRQELTNWNAPTAPRRYFIDCGIATSPSSSHYSHINTSYKRYVSYCDLPSCQSHHNGHWQTI